MQASFDAGCLLSLGVLLRLAVAAMNYEIYCMLDDPCTSSEVPSITQISDATGRYGDLRFGLSVASVVFSDLCCYLESSHLETLLVTSCFLDLLQAVTTSFKYHYLPIQLGGLAMCLTLLRALQLLGSAARVSTLWRVAVGLFAALCVDLCLKALDEEGAVAGAFERVLALEALSEFAPVEASWSLQGGTIYGTASKRRRFLLHLQTREVGGAIGFFQDLTGLAQVPMLALDPAGRVRRWNSAMEQLSGYKEEDVLGNAFRELLVEEFTLDNESIVESLPKHQMAEWEDKAVAERVFSKLGELPPLVQPKECERLKLLLAECGRGERFIVQGGDCAERFMDCKAGRLEQQLKLILQMGMIIEHLSGKKTLKVCRIAGQYGKPRSKPTEMVEGKEIMSFKGDNINGFDPKDRALGAMQLDLEEALTRLSDGKFYNLSAHMVWIGDRTRQLERGSREGPNEQQG
eukprot:g22179.t1